MSQPNVVIVDYGMGNLFSIKNAFQAIGLETLITSSGKDILAADGVILPGVGAFGKAMTTLNDLGLVEVLQKAVQKDKPLLGICLGMQLLMSQSSEFGQHKGLEIFPGTVVRFDEAQEKSFKIPHIGWNAIYPPAPKDIWDGSSLDGLVEGEFMYFVHSYVLAPKDPGVVLATTEYGGHTYCAVLGEGNIIGTQFHPEKSGEAGLKLLSNFIDSIK